MLISRPRTTSQHAKWKLQGLSGSNEAGWAQGVQIEEIYTNLQPGALVQTENTLDFRAFLKDMGIFGDPTPGGQRLTRDGAFTLNSEGMLVTYNGDLV